MTANADTFVGWLIVICVCAYIAADRLIVALAWWDRRNEECDRVEAADWFEDYFADATQDAIEEREIRERRESA